MCACVFQKHNSRVFDIWEIKIAFESVQVLRERGIVMRSMGEYSIRGGDKKNVFAPKLTYSTFVRGSWCVMAIGRADTVGESEPQEGVCIQVCRGDGDGVGEQGSKWKLGWPWLFHYTSIKTVGVHDQICGMVHAFTVRELQTKKNDHERRKIIIIIKGRMGGRIWDVDAVGSP